MSQLVAIIVAARLSELRALCECADSLANPTPSEPPRLQRSFAARVETNLADLRELVELARYLESARRVHR